ncbi:hypothetical protein ACGFNP_60040 [Nonomuraea sp. NPDC049269]|uniref:hypothetical protein n=1 Tax=Nonomuraea sp. NPDC049269 TaxID=3364349 RepID=UPI0037219CB3
MDDLTQAYGEKFLMYALVSEYPAIDYSDKPAEAIQVLREIAQQIEGVTDPFGKYINLQHAIGSIDDSGLSLANRLRLVCGGDLPEATDGDPVAALALAVARETYPLYLLLYPDSISGGRIGAPTIAYTHPASIPFCRAALQDPSLANLFPGVDTEKEVDPHAISSSIILSNGSGSGIQLIGLLPSMLDAAWRWCVLDSRPTAATYLEKVRAILGQIRLLAEGKKINVPHVIGIRGVDVPETITMKLPFGIIKSSVGWGVIGTPEIENQASALLVMHFPLEVLWIGREESNDEEQSKKWDELKGKFAVPRDENSRKLAMVQLSLLLASSEDRPKTATVAFDIILNPGILSGMSYGFNPTPMFRPAAAMLDETAARRVESWAKVVAERHPSSLDITMRRLITAFTVDRDPTDALIDGVICWENMLGSPQEAVLRVTSSMAKLIESRDPEKRKVIHAELKDIYKARSALVHGNSKQQPKRDKLHQYKNASLQYAIETLLRLYERPALLVEKDSGMRSQSILLDTYETTIRPLDAS